MLATWTAEYQGNDYKQDI